MEFVVLLVDDHPPDLRCLERVIRKPAKLICCRSGAAARAAFLDETQLVCGAIIDNRLPDDNGIELLAWARQAGHRMPALIVSGGALRADDHARLAELDATFESKPVTTRRTEQLVIEAAMTCVASSDNRAAARRIALGGDREEDQTATFRDRLSVAEARVLGHLADGVPRCDLEAVLERSRKTIDEHVGQILRKTGMADTSHLLSYVLRLASSPDAFGAIPDNRSGALRAGPCATSGK